MSLPILVLIVVAGIAAIVYSVHRTGGSRRAALADQAQALARFAEDFPDEHPRGAHITLDRGTAFLELDRGRTGVVHALGDKFLTRILTAADIRRLDHDGGATLSLELGDFAWRGGRFTFARAADAGIVATRLSPANQNQRRRTA